MFVLLFALKTYSLVEQNNPRESLILEYLNYILLTSGDYFTIIPFEIIPEYFEDRQHCVAPIK